MYDQNTVDRVCAWTTEVERQAENKGFIFDENIELFLEIYEDDCSYYLVDRATQTLFWLSEYTTAELGLKPVISDSHLSKSQKKSHVNADTDMSLELLLEVQYWCHIENFCMHFGGLPQKAIDDLILVFLHALGGQSETERQHSQLTN